MKPWCWSQDSLADARGSVQALVTYLDTFRWLFIALALAGIALTIHARLDDWRRGQR